ncbi:MAG: HAMP domain-containing sensor histidine kinase [Acidimicrobiales bacterium]
MKRRAGEAEVGPAPFRRPDPVSRVQSSMLLKIMGALVVAVVGSSTLTAFLESRLARSALRSQAVRVTAANLRLMEQSYDGRDRTLKVALRNLAQSLTRDRLLEPDRYADLVRELGTVSRNLELDTLQVVDATGQPLDQPAGSGAPLSGPVPVSRVDRRAPSSRLITLADGRWVQAVAMPVGSEVAGPLLVGGFAFGDPFSYELRRILRDRGHVVLVADGSVVGSTLTDPPDGPPGAGEGGVLPVDPAVVRVDDQDTLVAYRGLVSAVGGADGALGVLLNDPEAALERSLSDTRLLAAAVLALLALAMGWVFFRALVRPLVSLEATAGRIARGDLEASFSVAGSDEIAALARSLEHMRLELRSQLELIAAQAADLKDSSQRIVAAQDEERHRLARDLHDGIQQQLVVLRMGFGLVKETADRVAPALAGSLAELSAELNAVIERVREVSHDLYPSILVDRGLAPALRSSLARLPLAARLECSPDPLPRVAPEIESGAYFLVGEALANAIKHAGAAEIAVRLEVRDGWLAVEVGDDGRGFAADDPAEVRSGGLLHMADRARSFGGELTITSQPGAGTTVRATFPLPARPVTPVVTPAG